MRNWEQIKKEEKGTTSIVDGITPGLPSLLYTHKLFRKAASVGLEIDDVDAALDRIDAALAALRAGRQTVEARLAGAGAGGVGDRRAVPAGSTPSPRCAAGPRATATASGPSNARPTPRASTSRPSGPTTPPPDPP